MIDKKLTVMHIVRVVIIFNTELNKCQVFSFIKKMADFFKSVCATFFFGITRTFCIRYRPEGFAEKPPRYPGSPFTCFSGGGGGTLRDESGQAPKRFAVAAAVDCARGVTVIFGVKKRFNLQGIQRNLFRTVRYFFIRAGEIVRCHCFHTIFRDRFALRNVRCFPAIS